MALTKSVPPESTVRILNQIDRLMSEVPHSPLVNGSILFSSNLGMNIYAQYNPVRRSITVNTKFAKDPNALDAGLKIGVTGGWNASGTGSLEGIISHEYGHSLDESLMGGRTLSLQESVSDYGRTNPHENFAEIFSYAIHNSARANEGQSVKTMRLFIAKSRK